MNQEHQDIALEWLQPLISEIRSTPKDQVSTKTISKLVSKFKESDGIAGTEKEKWLHWVWLLLQHRPNNAWFLKDRFRRLYLLLDTKELPEQVLDIIEEILKDVQDMAVRVRLLDFMASEVQGKRRFEAAQEAVHTFFTALRSMLQAVDWSSEIADYVQRGCAISIQMGNPRLKSFVWNELSDLAKTYREEKFSRFYLDLAEAGIKMWGKGKAAANAKALQSMREYLPTVAAHFDAGGNPLLSRKAMEDLAILAGVANDPVEEKRWTIERARSLQQEAQRREEPETATTGALVAAVLYEQSYYVLKKLLSKYNDDDIRIEVESAKKRIISYLGAASYRIDTHEYPLSKEAIEALKQDGKLKIDVIMQQERTQERIDALVFESYVPDLDTERKTVSEMLEGLIFWRISPTRLIEQDRFVAHYREDNYLDFQVDEMILNRLKMHLRFVFQPALVEMLRQDRPALIDNLVSSFESRGLVDPRCRALLRTSFEAWTSGSHAVVLHMLIPRFEASFRRLLKARGAKTVAEKTGTYQELSLDALLINGIAAGFPDGLIRLFRIVFTLQGRPNLRNGVSHGLAIDVDCNELSVCLVLYCYLQLLRWEISILDAHDEYGKTGLDASKTSPKVGGV